MVTSKLAEEIAASLKGKLEYHPRINGKGNWYELNNRDGQNYSYQLSKTKARKWIAKELGKRYMTTSGYSQADLNHAVKFMQMYLSK